MRVSTESPSGVASATLAFILRAASRVLTAADSAAEPADSAGCNARDSSQAAFDGSSFRPVPAWSDSQFSGRRLDMHPPPVDFE